MEVGGLVQVSLGFFVVVENHPKIPLNQHRYVGVVYHIGILSVYTLLKVVSYDLNSLSMSVMIFHKKSVDGGGGWVGAVSSI